jgi:hypothetical protein
MRDVRQHKAPLDDRGCLIAHDLPWRADLDRRNARIAIQGGLQQSIDLCARQIAMRATVEHHVKCVDRALRLPEMIGDDTDRVVARRSCERRMLRASRFVGDCDGCDSHHRAHARPSEDLGFVSDRCYRAGEGRCHPDRRIEHAGDGDIDAEERAAGRLGSRIQPWHRLADQGELARLLEPRPIAEGKPGGGRRKLTIG